MRGRLAFILLVILIVMSQSVIRAENESPTAVPSPTVTRSLIHPFPVGPTDFLERARTVSGTITLFARPTREASIANVEFFIDAKSVGKTNELPYKLEYDTSELSTGEHVVKAVGFDAKGKEVWAASAKAATGSIAGATAPPVNARSINSNPGNVSTENANLRNEPGKPGVDIEQPKVLSPREASRLPSPNMAPDSAGLKLTRTYTNPMYSFSISYPQAWTASDRTEDMKPKQDGNAWIVFGSEPIDAADIVVNLKRTQLQEGTDVDVFAKYNSYVKQWKRTALLGSSAFVTTDGKPENKRVIHRAIIIKDGCAWMMNCIDNTGKPAAESKKLFDSMIDTLSTRNPVQPVVTITEGATID